MTDTKKPFVCVEQGCGMVSEEILFCKLSLKTLLPIFISFQSFTNEDHLTVHKKKHDMCLSIAGKHTFIGA